MNLMSSRAALAELRSQWRGSVRLRVGVAAIAGIVWLWMVLVVLDEAKALRDQAHAARTDLEQLRPLAAGAQWRARAEEARSLLEAARELQWVAASSGAAEARLQDMLRELCAKAGLAVVDLSVVQGAAAQPGPTAAGGALRARLVTEFNRQALLSLLAELQGMKPLVMVDVVKLRPALVPGRAELEIRVQTRLQDDVKEVKP